VARNPGPGTKEANNIVSPCGPKFLKGLESPVSPPVLVFVPNGTHYNGSASPVHAFGGLGGGWPIGLEFCRFLFAHRRHRNEYESQFRIFLSI
jgi:hypothetical protein